MRLEKFLMEKLSRRFIVESLGASVARIFLPQIATLEKPQKLLCPIYYWHEVRSKAEFRSFADDLLNKTYFPVAMRDIADYFDGNTQVWPDEKKPAVITFDDGLLSQFENALPILDEYRLRATFFVLQNYADGVHQYMNDSQIKVLTDGGWEAAVHGYTHKPLPVLRIQNPVDWRDDIITAKDRLEQITSKKVHSFAYPYGRSGGVDQETRLLVAANYRIAVSTGGNAPFLNTSNLYELPRLWKS